MDLHLARLTEFIVGGEKSTSTLKYGNGDR